MVVNKIGPQQETEDQSVGQEDPLEQGVATHSLVLAWENPIDGAWRLQRTGPERARHHLATEQQFGELVLKMVY